MLRLGDIATVITKGTTPTSIGFAFQNKGISFIKIESIDENGNLICEKFDHISNECHEKLKRSQLQENDILFSIAGAIGRTAIVTKDILPANTNQALAIIRIPQGIINYSFLLYILQSSVVLEQAEKKKQGVAQLNLSLKDIGDFIIPDIPLEEQQCIVDILDKVSNLISLRKQQISKLDELVKSRFIELFGDPVACKNKRKVSEIGKVFTGNTPSMKEPSYYESNDIPFIKPSDLNESGVTSIDGVEAYISEKARPVARIIPPDAVLVTCIGTIGKIGISARESCCNQQINFVIPNDGINSVYLAHCLTFFKSTLQNIANAPVVPIINKTQFSELEIPVFDTAKQNQFAAFVEQTDKSKLEIQKSLEKLETLKKALMQKYFG